MHDVTNLQWPETPFGADQRPLGHRSPMLAAFAMDWTVPVGGKPMPVVASTVYLRLRRHGPSEVSEDALPFGFRAVVIEDAADIQDLLVLIDRALVRARRHAVIVAGHGLETELARMADLSPSPLRGVTGVRATWTNRGAKERGMALMVDTAAEARPFGATLSTPLEPAPAVTPPEIISSQAVARRAVARCLAIGLAAGAYAGRYRWEGIFPVTDAVDHTAWDVLLAGRSDNGDEGRTDTPIGPPAARELYNTVRP